MDDQFSYYMPDEVFTKDGRKCFLTVRIYQWFLNGAITIFFIYLFFYHFSLIIVYTTYN